ICARAALTIACPRTEPTESRSSSRPPEPEEMRTSLSRAFQVLGPTTPSTPIPAADCRARTALAVPLPKTPSTAIEAPLAFRPYWSVLTAAPRSPLRSFGCPTEAGGADGAEVPPEPIEVPLPSAAHVLGPTTASTPMPALDCRARTAEAVAEPNTPSTRRDAPEALSCFCRLVTAAPREPTRSLGCEVLGAVAAVPVSAPQVLGPTTPSTPMPARDCWLFTARRVAEPKTPSTLSEAPCAFSRSCR